MRLYTFTNFYLSSIQQGIQPAHVISDMYIKYVAGRAAPLPQAGVAFQDWAARHKTMICLNGGHHGSIKAIAEQLEVIGNELNLPTAAFHEDEESLGGIMTSTGIVVPAEIYERAAEIRNLGKQSIEEVSFTKDPELRLIDLLNGYPLAK